MLVCPDALAASSSCSVLSDRWFTPHLSLLTKFSLSAWDAKVKYGLRLHALLGSVC